MYVEIQPEGDPYPVDVATFDMHPLISSQNMTIGVPVTYGFTFALSTPGQYRFRICARDSAGYECTTDWITGLTVNPLHDIAVVNIVPSKTIVEKGYSVANEVTVINLGSSDEISSVTLYADKTIIGTVTNVTIPRGCRTTVDFAWNTGGFAKGDRTLSAYASSVPGETDTADNTLVGGKVSLTYPCFIGTAAYGTATAEQVDVLREFRDGVLLENTVGSQFVGLYYQLSPPVADFIAGNEFVRTLARELLVDPVVWLVEATGDIWRN